MGSGSGPAPQNVPAFKQFPDDWTLDGTMAQLIADINADDTAVAGMAYAGTVEMSDLPASMVQAELQAQVITVDENLGKVILFTATSNNTAPYHWEYTSAYGATGQWRGFATDGSTVTLSVTFSDQTTGTYDLVVQ